LDIGTVSPYVTAFIVAVAAMLVGALNQRHRTIEKRMDELYSPLYRYAWLSDRDRFPRHGEHDYVELLDLLHNKNYLMSQALHYFYFGYVIAAKPTENPFAGARQDEFVNIVRADYERIREQYLSFWALLRGLFKPNILGYYPTGKARKCPKCGLENAPTLQLCMSCGANLWPK